MKGIAIVTKFLGPTNHRGNRVKAYIPSGKSVTLHWDHAIDYEENHLRAAAMAYQKFILAGSLDLAPWVRLTRDAYGVKGYVHIVDSGPKDRAIKY